MMQAWSDFVSYHNHLMPMSSVLHLPTISMIPLVYCLPPLDEIWLCEPEHCDYGHELEEVDV